VLDKLEKNYLDSLKLMSLYESVEKNQQGKTKLIALRHEISIENLG